jgi:hypothetical protein
MNAFRWLLQGLHESRKRHAEREIRRHAHLIVQAQQRDPRVKIQAAGWEKTSLWSDVSASAAGAGG